MKIEDAIQQKKFLSEHQKAHVNILYTASWLNQRTTSLLKPYRLTWQQFNILRILRGKHPEPASVKLLTSRMIDKMSNASRLVDKLEDKGLVERTTSDTDRRRVDICITTHGLVLLEEVSNTLETGLQFEEGLLSPQEAEQLNQLLNKMRTTHEERYT